MKHAALMVALAMVVISAESKTPAQKPRFEVASIKPNRSGSSYLTSNGFQACNYVANNATLKTMVTFAYRLPSGQVLPLDRVIGGPSWIETDHFDVESKRRNEADSISLDQVLLMVQSVLEERFQLRTHWSTQDLPVYDLAVAKDGLKLKKSENQTQLPPPAGNPVLHCSGTPGGPPPLPAPSTGSSGGTEPRGPITTTFDSSGVSITSTSVMVSTLVDFLQEYTDHPIINKTGLAGVYQFKLRFSPERLGVTRAASGPSIFIATQELGLKLESNKAPLDVLLIDSVQRPSEN